MINCSKYFFNNLKVYNMMIKKNIPAGCIILFFFMLFSLDSTLYGIYDINFFPQAGFMQIAKYFTISLFVWLGIFFKFPVIKIKRSVFQSVGLLLMLMLLAMVFNQDSGGTYFILAIVCAFIFVNMVSFEEFTWMYRRIMIVISFISVLIHVFFSMFASAYDLVSSFLSMQGFLSLSLLKIISACYGMGKMNAGFFRERGVFALYLTLAIFFLFYGERDFKKNRRKNKLELLLYTVTLISTRGSTAALTLLMIFVSLFVKFLCRGKVPRYIIILFIFSVPLVLCYLPNSLELLFEKMDFESNLADSGIARVASFIVPLRVVLTNPFFGVGVDTFNDDYMQLSQMYIGHQSSSFTNTFTGLAVYFGIPFVLIVLCGFYKISIKLESFYFNRLVIFLLLLFQYFAQPEYCIGIFWILILFGFDKGLVGCYEKN